MSSSTIAPMVALMIAGTTPPPMTIPKNGNNQVPAPHSGRVFVEPLIHIKGSTGCDGKFSPSTSFTPRKRQARQHATENGTARIASAGCGRRYWARMMVSSQPRAWLGVAAAHATYSNILIAGIAGLVAGSMSMAAGEYVSVHSQADTEQADLERERVELATDGESEHKELAAIYVARGLDPSLARQVAEQLMAHDAIGAHARDELGISEILNARPIQAALASASSFAVGAILPLLVTALAPEKILIVLVSATSLLFLAILGATAARVGGAGVIVGAARVTLWGALAMAVTAGVRALFGTII